MTTPANGSKRHASQLATIFDKYIYCILSLIPTFWHIYEHLILGTTSVMQQWLCTVLEYWFWLWTSRSCSGSHKIVHKNSHRIKNVIEKSSTLREREYDPFYRIVELISVTFFNVKFYDKTTASKFSPCHSNRVSHTCQLSNAEGVMRILMSDDAGQRYMY